MRTDHQLNFSVPPLLFGDPALREGDQVCDRVRVESETGSDLHGAGAGAVHEWDPGLVVAEELEDADAGSGGAGVDDDAEERGGLWVGEFGGGVDLVGGGEEVEEERDGEERSEEEEAFGVERVLLLLLARVWLLGEEVHTGVELSAVRRNEGGGRGGGVRR